MMVMAAALFHDGGLTGIDSIEGAFEGLQTTVSDNAATIFGIALLASGFASSSVGHDGRPGRDAGLHPAPDPDLPAPRDHPRAGADRARDRARRRPTRWSISQVVLSFGIPFALIPLLMIARKREVMGALANPGWLTAIAGVLGGVDHRPQRVPAPAGVLRLSAR